MSPDESRPGRLEEVVADYLRQVDSGQRVDRASFLAAHPDLADELREFFEASDEFEQLTGAASGSEEAISLTLPLRPLAPRASSTVRLFGDYELIAEVGHGGMGVVYRARQPSLGRDVALKMLLAVRLPSADDVERFRREAQACAQLDHPNLVPIYDVGEAHLDGVGPAIPYFTMKYLDGGTLAQRTGGRPVDPVWAARLVAPVARAVHHAHMRGVLHRDLKPGNILLDEKDRPHVADFGLARWLEVGAGLTRTGEVLGTPGYMAPEQAEGGRGAVTTATDVYGLGAVLYECLTGRPPFRAETPVETLLQVREREPDRPSRLTPGLSSDLETICLKCLEKEPARRYSSAEAVAEDLERWLRGEPIAARRARVWERLMRWVRRRPGVASLALLSALLAVGGAVAVVLGLVSTRLALAETSRALDEAEDARHKADTALEEKTQALEAEAKARRDLAVALDMAEARLYDYQLLQAEAAWRAGQIGRAEQLLRENAPPQPRWDWNYVRQLCHSELLTYRGHLTAVRAVAVSPDGARVATGSMDGTAQVWEAATGKRVRLLSAGLPRARLPFPTCGLSFSRDGKQLAFALAESIHLWDLETGQKLRTFQGPPGTLYVSVALAPDGRRLAGGGIRPEGTNVATLRMTVWDAVSGDRRLERTGPLSAWCAVTYHPDGKRLAYGGHTTPVTVLDSESGEALFAAPAKAPALTSLTYSPDGSLLAAGHADGRIALWDGHAATSPTEPRTILRGTDRAVFHLAFSPDSQRLAATHRSQIVTIWDIKKENVHHLLRGHALPIDASAFAQGGRLLVTGSSDCTARVWNATTPQDGQPFSIVRQWVRHVTFRADHARYAAAAVSRVFVGDVKEGTTSLLFDEPGRTVASLALSPDGARLAVAFTGENAVALWDVASRQQIATLRGHEGAVHCVAYHPDGHLLATGGEDRTVRLWEAVNGTERRALPDHAGPVTQLAFREDGQWLAAACPGREVRLWDVAEGRSLLAFPPLGQKVNDLAFSPDSRHLAAVCESPESAVGLWDARDGRLVHRLRGHPSGTTRVAFTRDGHGFVSGGRDGSVKLWDRKTGQEVISLPGPTSAVVHLSFTRDGRHLIGIYHQRTEHRLWDAGPSSLTR